MTAHPAEHRIKELFNDALDLDEAERPAFMDGLEDDAVRVEVRRLIEAHERGGRFLAEPEVGDALLDAYLSGSLTASVTVPAAGAAGRSATNAYEPSSRPSASPRTATSGTPGGTATVSGAEPDRARPAPAARQPASSPAPTPAMSRRLGRLNGRGSCCTRRPFSIASSAS